MIELTRLDDTKVILNDNFIEIIQEAPDTVVTMQNGHIYIVKETIEQIKELLSK